MESELERSTGIEPVAQAWEAWVLPLYELRVRRVPGDILGTAQPAGNLRRPYLYNGVWADKAPAKDYREIRFT